MNAFRTPFIFWAYSNKWTVRSCFICQRFYQNKDSCGTPLKSSKTLQRKRNRKKPSTLEFDGEILRRCNFVASPPTVRSIQFRFAVLNQLFEFIVTEIHHMWWMCYGYQYRHRMQSTTFSWLSQNGLLEPEKGQIRLKSSKKLRNWSILSCYKKMLFQQQIILQFRVS